MTGRTYDEQRYSPLTQIDADNVGRLGLAWYIDLDTRRAQEATPLAVAGVLYVATAWSKVLALDAVTGRTLWQFDPQVPGAAAARACCDVVNRGVAYWKGRVYVGTIDGRLIALDARSGRLIWSTLTIDPAQRYSITGAPRIVKGKVIIGNGGAEFGVRGYVSAYDWESGALAWRFYFVPGDPSKPFEHPILEKAAKTWTGKWWLYGGGGTAWDSMAYDPELDLLYVGTGNGSPWNQQIRSPGGGDNLFLSSIVALRADTGDYVWHYQTTPGESWDYTATQHMILADVVADGQRRKVLMQAPKNGFFYVLDRETGRLLSARNFVPVNWASGIDLVTGRPIEDPNARYGTRGTPWLATPGPFGAHNWQPMAFSAQTGLVYIPAQETSFPYIPEGAFRKLDQGVNLGADMTAASLPQDPASKQAILSAIKGHLLAWDPLRQREVWRAQYASPWNGGVLATAGNLVFQGTARGELRAYRANTGQLLWSFDAQTGIGAAPISQGNHDIDSQDGADGPVQEGVVPVGGRHEHVQEAHAVHQDLDCRQFERQEMQGNDEVLGVIPPRVSQQQHQYRRQGRHVHDGDRLADLRDSAFIGAPVISIVVAAPAVRCGPRGGTARLHAAVHERGGEAAVRRPRSGAQPRGFGGIEGAGIVRQHRDPPRHLRLEPRREVTFRRKDEIDDVDQQKRRGRRHPPGAPAFDEVARQPPRLQQQCANAAPDASVEIGCCFDELLQQMSEAAIRVDEALFARRTHSRRRSAQGRSLRKRHSSVPRPAAQRESRIASGAPHGTENRHRPGASNRRQSVMVAYAQAPGETEGVDGHAIEIPAHPRHGENPSAREDEIVRPRLKA